MSTLQKAKLKSEVEAKALEMAKVQTRTLFLKLRDCFEQLQWSQDKASGKAKAKKQAKKLTEVRS